MNAQYIFICWGNKSDIGKDKVADIIDSFIPTDKIKFNRAFKTPMEQWLNIPYGSLDDKEFRKQYVVNPVTSAIESKTYDELMVDAFHHFPNLYPTGENWLVPGWTKQVIENNHVRHMTIVDLRNRTELELLRQLSPKYNMILLHIVPGERGVQKTSDTHIRYDDFDFVKHEYTICNKPYVDIEMLTDQVRYVLQNEKLLQEQP
ncbi:hypothetical protein [Scytonema sp. NUACC26]|uniref:hypothetical protein n=1 Tax=Scytonema sp. NUACC26 TaxID=3140176 RepID=UPI0034DB8EAF